MANELTPEQLAELPAAVQEAFRSVQKELEAQRERADQLNARLAALGKATGGDVTAKQLTSVGFDEAEAKDLVESGANRATLVKLLELLCPVTMEEPSSIQTLIGRTLDERLANYVTKKEHRQTQRQLNALEFKLVFRENAPGGAHEYHSDAATTSSAAPEPKRRRKSSASMKGMRASARRQAYQVALHTYKSSVARTEMRSKILKSLDARRARINRADSAGSDDHFGCYVGTESLSLGDFCTDKTDSGKK